jgi:regulator of sigma E protease
LPPGRCRDKRERSFAGIPYFKEDNRTFMHDFLVSAVAFIVLIGVMVVVHEFGHFLVAKLCGVRVERFSIGFPPRLFGIKIGDTDYCVSATPLGG